MMHKQTYLRILLAATLVSFLSSNSYAGRGTDTDIILLGDVNLDGVVDKDDVSPFISILMTGSFQAEADIDRNGIVNSADIQPFVEVLYAPPVVSTSYASIEANAPGFSGLCDYRFRKSKQRIVFHSISNASFGGTVLRLDRHSSQF